jgi:hypothetical protein
MHRAHDMLKQGFAKKAEEAGCQTSIEPGTHTLLEGVSAAQARTLFYKKQTKKQKQSSADIVAMMALIRSMPPGKDRDGPPSESSRRH